jgi:hypothetical protein
MLTPGRKAYGRQKGKSGIAGVGKSLRCLILYPGCSKINRERAIGKRSGRLTAFKPEP